MKQCVFDGGNRTNFYYYEHARRLVKETHTCTGVVQESSSFVYDGLDIVAKVDNLTGEMIYFTRGLGVAPGVGDVLAESHIASNGSLKYTLVYVQNHRGDTIALVSNSTVVARYEYSAWGVPEPLNPEPSMVPWFSFSGKHYDTYAALYYYGYRWYDSQAKRWTQPDPSGLAEGLDLYQFCKNNPICGVDVYGASVWSVIQGFAENACNGCANECADAVSGLISLSVSTVARSFYDVTETTIQSCAQQNAFGNGQEQGSRFFGDYWTANVNIAIPNPYTLTWVGWSGTLTVDRFGLWYWSPLGIGVGKSWTGLSGSVQAGWLLRGQPVTQETLDSFLTGHGLNITAGYWGGGGFSWSPSNGWRAWAAQLGIVSPQAGISYNYSFRLLPGLRKKSK